MGRARHSSTTTAIQTTRKKRFENDTGGTFRRSNRQERLTLGGNPTLRGEEGRKERTRVERVAEEREKQGRTKNLWCKEWKQKNTPRSMRNGRTELKNNYSGAPRRTRSAREVCSPSRPKSSKQMPYRSESPLSGTNGVIEGRRHEDAPLREDADRDDDPPEDENDRHNPPQP